MQESSPLNEKPSAGEGDVSTTGGFSRSCSIFLSRVRGFKLWNAWTGVVLLLAVHAGLLAYSATRHSPTLNEPGHLVAGLSHWKFGRFEVYRVNPPLTHYLSAIPVILADYEEDWSGFYDSPGARPEFKMGEDFIAANGERSIWLFTIARWACIPISLVGGLFCFLWSRELWSSNLAGLISLTLWCFEPNILAHGELITPDCAATSFGLGAGYFFWRWLRRPTWSRAASAGLLLGLALLSKSSWIILFGLWPLLWLFWLTTNRRPVDQPSTLNHQLSALHSPPSTIHRAAQLVSILLLGVYVLNLGYGFDGTFTRLKEFTFVSSALTGHEKPGAPGNRFADTPLAALPVPLPRQYVRGIDLQKKDFEHYGQPSYLRGEW
ncbi:MAG: phospholipid carrier-dependent glycosyltransferase, partial [Planctomycetaceae bacterium]|nr:phospholipid carrier-dependent glycosyltransferase [Planctomycetaceae bacterium]